jgi:Tfp pilus assembly protein PilV
MTVKRHKFAAAVTLIEVMTSVLIVTIVLTGAYFLFVAGGNQITVQERHRIATQLAAQRLEELKAGNYGDIATEGPTTIPLDDVSYNRSVLTENLGSYKKVTVTVSWGPTGNEHNTTLVTFIAPKG